MKVFSQKFSFRCKNFDRSWCSEAETKIKIEIKFFSQSQKKKCCEKIMNEVNLQNELNLACLEKFFFASTAKLQP
jgi:hypothetical protein